MARKTIKQPSLYLRSAYCIDLLTDKTGLGMSRLERRIRDNQYIAKGLQPPSCETVRDYFRLYRSIAFEPHRFPEKPDDTVAPWLLAMELEFPGSAFAYFHPLFDLLFAVVESTAFWNAHFSQIPTRWITDADSRGDHELAADLREINAATLQLKHRKRPQQEVDRLDFLQLSLLRLPSEISGPMFGPSTEFEGMVRNYPESMSNEVDRLVAIGGFDALTALVLLAREAAHNGFEKGMKLARVGAVQLTASLPTLPGCRRIGDLLKPLLMDNLLRINVRHFSRMRHLGFGLPASWSAMLNEPYMDTFIDCGHDTEDLG